MQPLPLHLGPGSDLRASLEQVAIEANASGFVLGVVGDLSQAAFQCPGLAEPTVLQGHLEIITLQGTLAPQGVHLHLSLSDGDCQVWGGHLEHGSLVLRGADLLVGFLAGGGGPGSASAEVASPDELVAVPGPERARPAAPMAPAPPRVEIAVRSGCPYSARALRMLRTLGIPHVVLLADAEAERQAIAERSGRGSLPQVFIDGEAIGGYDALADLHGRGALDHLR
jgi:predicted DNA-binding protein with PD1-like motif/glutaredoxin